MEVFLRVRVLAPFGFKVWGAAHGLFGAGWAAWGSSVRSCFDVNATGSEVDFCLE
jgi:hypothetical protein